MKLENHNNEASKPASNYKTDNYSTFSFGLSTGSTEKRFCCRSFHSFAAAASSFYIFR